MRGVNPLDLSMSQGKLTLPIIMESTDDGTTVTFTKGTSIKTKDEIAYGGYLIGPKSVSLGTLSGKLPDQDIIKAFKI